MKVFLALFLAFLLALPVSMAAKHKQYDPFQGFDPHDVEVAAVGAISIPNPNSANGDGPYAMICSGSVIGYEGTSALFVTAKHCVWEDGDPENDVLPGFIPNEFVSFNGNLAGPYYQTELYSISQDDDLAVLKVINGLSAAHPIIPETLEHEDFLQPGDPVENVSFPLDMGKVEFHGTYVDRRFPHFSRMLQDYPQWKNTMPVDITIGHGSSGSPLFDSRTHKMIGVMVGSVGEARLMIAEPETVIEDLLLNPGKNSVSAWIGGHLPKDQTRLPRKYRECEQHPLIPGLSS